MSSTISALGTEQINRLRVGIATTKRGELSDYVLSDFSSKELETLKETIQKAASACSDWITQGSDYVMRNYNRRGG
jgi:PTH1 family peptidyl-tRNA hydrolase